MFSHKRRHTQDNALGYYGTETTEKILVWHFLMGTHGLKFGHSVGTHFENMEPGTVT